MTLSVDIPKTVECFGGGSIPITQCPGGSGKKAAVYKFLKISRDKNRLYCKKCSNKEWMMQGNKGSLST